MTRAAEHGPSPSKRDPRNDLIPREYLKIIAVWSLIPGYLVAGLFVGWLLDRWWGSYPWMMAICVLAALVMAVRDVYRLKDQM